ncbi:MAG: site-2 protease family protein [Candidatus Eremiobacteraeota bacterium]|nr:site-2 protease family protein [Candidatus Eremiobacteraeota bacterium]
MTGPFMSEVVQLEKLLTFLITLSALVVLHELGHFLMARRYGVRVNEFAVGFGPKLWKWTSPRSGTTYAINLLPIGGYCAMQGEDGKTSEAGQKREFEAHAGALHDSDNFQAKPTWQRLAIIVAGPVANFILAFLILFMAAVIFGVKSESANQPIVGPLVAGMPAQKAGVQVGDKVLSINGADVTNGTRLIDTIHTSLGKHLKIALSHNGVPYTVDVVPLLCPGPNPKKFGCIGFQPVPVIVHVGIGQAFTGSLADMRNMWDQTVGGLGLLISHPRQYGGQVTGVVGMGRAAAAYQDFGPALYLQLAALISFTLGVFNLLPFPALDGGRAVFIIAEMLRGKPVDPEKEALVHVAGFAVLMLLMIVVTYHDISNLVAGKGVF